MWIALTLEEQARLGEYEELAPLNAAHGVMLVRHRQSGLLFVKKVLSNYQPLIFRQLQARPFYGLPRIIEAVEDEGRLIVIESFISGQTLQERLDRSGPFPRNEALDILLSLCQILGPLHEAGIIHRDIKPSNIMLSEGGQVVLLDLDAAKIHKPQESRDTRLIGTKGYAAPEQYGFGASTPATDIYAMGVLLNMLLTGVFPHEKYPPDFPLKAIILRCTRLEPAERFAQVEELAGMLEKQIRQEAYDRAPTSDSVPPSYPAPDSAPFREPSPAPDTPRKVTGPRAFLPPGFRSGNPKNMLLASLWYLSMVGVLFKSYSEEKPAGDRFLTLLFTLVFFLAFPVIFYNYRGILDRSGISRKEPKSRRTWACVGLYVLVLTLTVLAGKLVQFALF